jgi:general stress protein 26
VKEDGAMTKTLADIAEDMRDIDFCTLATIAVDGSIASRPMSNNAEVEYDGRSWFFTTDDATMSRDIAAVSRVGSTYAGKAGIKGLPGAPGMFIHVEGSADLIRDKA